MHIRTLELDYELIDEAFLCTLKLPELRILIIGLASANVSRLCFFV
jgi:hypothetical protein